MDTRALEDIGLTKGEIRVYFALLETGLSSTGPIIDKSGVSSSKVYGLLNQLVQKGLVSYIVRGGVRYYEAALAERLLDYIHEKEGRLKAQEKEIIDILPKLEQRRRSAGEKSEAVIYKGHKGMQTALMDILKDVGKNETMYVLGMPQFSKSLKRAFVRFQRDRAERGITARLAISEDAKDVGRELNKLPLSEIKYVQRELFTPSVFTIFGDKILISVGSEDLSLFLIKNKEVADSFRAYFNNIWEQKVRVYYGKKGPTRVLEEIVEVGKRGIPDYGFGTPEDHYMNELPDVLYDHFEKSKKYKLKTKLIFGEGFKSPNPVAKIRHLPEHLVSPVRTMIYGNKVAIVDFTKPTTTIIIEKKGIAEGYKKYFNMLWRVAKK